MSGSLHAAGSSTSLGQPIVMDCGSGYTKAGYAGDERPRSYIPTCVGTPKHPRVMAGGAVEGNKFIGNAINQHRGLLRINHPMSHGVVTDWAAMEDIWEHIYDNELKTQSELHPLLVTEPPLNPRNNRESMCSILFESFNVPAVQVSIQAVLSLYASGRTTGVVLDSGDGVTHCVPIYEGFAITNAIQRMDLAGRDITNRLKMSLQRAGYQFNTSAELEIVRIIKEKACYIARDIRKEEKEYLMHLSQPRHILGESNNKFDTSPVKQSMSQNKENASSMDTEKVDQKGGATNVSKGQVDTTANEFILPDGNVIKLGAERFTAPELLFNPSLGGLELPGVHELIAQTIESADLDLRGQLYENIVLSGGTTTYAGFGDRLLKELRRGYAPPDVKVRIFAPPERKLSTWVGGSILASLSTFKKMWVSAQEYQEDPNIIHRKFMA